MSRLPHLEVENVRKNFRKVVRWGHDEALVGIGPRYEM
jgi:hypothetical protein